MQPIVVGLGAGAGNCVVLEWAAVRAAAGRTRLHVVHAYGPPPSIDPYGLAVWWDPAPRNAALTLVEAAARHARATMPGVEVTTCVRATNPVSALITEGRNARLIVVGRSRPSRFSPWVRTLTSEVVRRARGRVVVVSEGDEVLR